MYKVFNMGHRMEIYCDKKDANPMIELAGTFQLEGKIIGRVEKGEKKLTIKSDYGEFNYWFIYPGSIALVST